MVTVLIISALVQFFAGTMVYVVRTIQGKSQPNRMTFLLWSIGPFIGVAAGISAGASWELIPVFMAGFGPLAILLSSFVNPKAYWKLGILDYICGTLAVMALVLWAATSNPLIAIAFAIAADLLAGVPTLIKSWKYPETETGWTYFVSFLVVVVGLAVAPAYTFAQIGFLIYLFFMDGALVIAVYRRRTLEYLRT